MSYKQAVSFDALRAIVAGSITNSYVEFGSATPLPAVAITFKNGTNGIVYVSFDGVTDNLAYPPTTFGVYDLSTNKPTTVSLVLPEGTPIMIKYSGSAPTTGSFYAEVVLANPG
jgi:hypothetical protein